MNLKPLLIGSAVLGLLATRVWAAQAPPVPIPPPRPIVSAPISLPLAPAGITSAPVVVPGTTAPQALPPVPVPPAMNTAFKWDAEQKEVTPKPGETNAPFTFAFTNTSSSEVIITGVRASCGCTMVSTPAIPWKIPAGSNGQISASVDLRGKSGVLMKSLSVDSTAGPKYLIMKINLGATDYANAASGQMDRVRNQQLAMTDRQVVFRGDCARCHVQPAVGKTGESLFSAACAICHEGPHRATMVPDLRALNKPTDAQFWRSWVMFGREGSLMPAFAQDRGGFLTPEQIESLVQYLTTRPKTAGVFQPAPVLPPAVK